MPYKILDLIEERIKQIFDEVIQWEHEFGTTVRKFSGETIIAGSPRNTKDEAAISETEGYANSFFVEEADLIRITFSSDDPSAEYINRDRPELEEMIIENINPEEIVGLMIANYFENKSL